MDTSELDSLLGRRRQPPRHAAKYMCTLLAIAIVFSCVIFAVWVVNGEKTSQTSESRMERAYYLMGKWIGMKQDMQGLDVHVNGMKDQVKKNQLELERIGTEVSHAMKRIIAIENQLHSLHDDVSDYVKDEMEKAILTLRDRAANPQPTPNTTTPTPSDPLPPGM
eukprot:c1382_g1_i2.p1 GENE.c1382_g1_i2~~c1382_g1_i2.p1  ORF type:complete len:165 (+),score=25.57 c1382_g1_i2:30-524(+)